ncbi:hypothetical protein Chor_003201 [Crotalus horridus]
MALLRGFLVCSLLLLSCICKEALGTRLLGGRENASPEEPGVAKALQFAMNEYNRGSNDMYSSRVSEVVEAQKQVAVAVLIDILAVRPITRYPLQSWAVRMINIFKHVLDSAIMFRIPIFYTMQIVSGIKYYFTVKIGRTVCRKGATDLENCAFHNAPKLAQTMTCTFEVYNIPWRNFISLEKSSCA